MSTVRHLLPVEVWLANDRVEIRKSMPAPQRNRHQEGIVTIHHDAARYLADQAAKKCRYHDVRLDPDTGWCYLCTCPKCDGSGSAIRYSPHGQNDPSLEETCDHCWGAA